MKKVAIFVIFAMLALNSLVYAAEVKNPYVPNQVLVVFQANTTQAKIDEINKSIGTKVIAVMMSRIYLVELPKDLSVETAIKNYKQFPEVESVEPNYVVKPKTKTP